MYSKETIETMVNEFSAKNPHVSDIRFFRKLADQAIFAVSLVEFIEGFENRLYYQDKVPADINFDEGFNQAIHQIKTHLKENQ